MRTLALIMLATWSVGCADDVPSDDAGGTTGTTDATSMVPQMSTTGDSSSTAADDATSTGMPDATTDGTETSATTESDDGDSSSSGSTSAGTTGTDDGTTDGTTDGGTTDGGTTGGGTDPGSSEGGSDTGMACLPDDDGAAIGSDCGPGGAMCPECYTCQPFVGFVLQETCQVLCEPELGGADCPAGLSCMMVADKTGMPWHQCG